MSISTITNHIDYSKLVRELNKTGLSVVVKNNSMLPEAVIRMSETANIVLPMVTLTLGALSSVGSIMFAYQKYKAMQNKDKEYPKPTLENIKQAHTALKKSENHLKNDESFTIAGRKNITDTLQAWRTSMLTFINMKAEDIKDDTKMVKSNFMFYGPTGTGKTYACKEIAKRAGFKLRQLPSATHIKPGVLGGFLTNESDNYRNYFNSLLNDRKNGNNIIVLIDEADQYITSNSPFENGQDHEFNKFIEALTEHSIPVMFTSNNPAKFEKRSMRRALDFQAGDYNNIDVNESYTYTKIVGGEEKSNQYNGKEAATDIIKDIFQNAGIDISKIKKEQYLKILDSCCDTQSEYLKNASFKKKQAYTTRHGTQEERKEDYKPLSMTGVHTFAALLVQKGVSDENIDKIITKITPEWLNTTDKPVNPDYDSGVGSRPQTRQFPF